MVKKKEPKPLTELFPRLFDGEYYIGTSIGNGWQQIGRSMCQLIQDSLSPEDLEKFSFIQIKEKFGQFVAYYRPTNTVPLSIIGTGKGFTNIEVPVSTEKQVPALTPEGLAIVRNAIALAEQKASHACENCPGVEGRLYAEGCWGVRCDKCALEEDRIFPKVYGELVEIRPHKSEFGGRQAISTHALFFRNTCAAAWHWKEDGQESNEIRQFVFLDDLPNLLVKGFMDNVHGYEVPYCDWDTPEGPMAIWADDFISYIKVSAAKDENAQGIGAAYLKVPDGAKVDARTQLERNIKDYFDIEANVTSLIPIMTMCGFAVGKLEDGTFQLFRINKENEPEEVSSPRHTLDSAIKNTEKLLASLQAARQLFEGSLS